MVATTLIIAALIVPADAGPNGGESRTISSSTLKELAPSKPGYAFAATQFVEFPRRYRELQPSEVLKATKGKHRMDVRFKDTVRAQVESKGFLCPRIGFQLYPIGALFETENGITVAAPNLHYTPWLTEYVERAKALKPGDEVIVEGIVEGPLIDRFIVVSDRIIMPEEEQSQVTYELKLSWPGVAEAKSATFTQPGHHAITIPGTSDKVTIRIDEMPIANGRALLHAIRFGLDSSRLDPKTYKKIEAEKLEGKDGPKDVWFADRVQAVAVPTGGDVSITTVAGATIPIEVYFRTDAGIRCLIPKADATLIERASRYYPGFHVEIKGTLLPSNGKTPTVLMDEFTQSDVKGPVEEYAAWVVTVSRPDGQQRVFATPGTYEMQLPVTDDKSEVLLMQMRQVRRLEPVKRSEIDKYIGQLDRSKFSAAHEGTVFVQFCLEELGTEGLSPNKFTYPPLWATVDPGMKVDPHHHPFPELYVFTNGEGAMQLGEEKFSVEKDMAVFIPSDDIHSVENDKAASEPLTWISIGLKP
jgi:mannose-6-phosphate isomerase-like protein (cupin superfamily)